MKAKIARNGNEIELTYQEMREIYDAVKRGYLKEDIESQAEEMKMELTEEEIDKVANIADKALERNDFYWDIYWESIEYAIESLKLNL